MDTAGAADPEDDAAPEAAERAEDETAISLLRPHITKQSNGRR